MVLFNFILYIVDVNYLDPILYGDLLLKIMVIKE